MGKIVMTNSIANTNDAMKPNVAYPPVDWVPKPDGAYHSPLQFAGVNPHQGKQIMAGAWVEPGEDTGTGSGTDFHFEIATDPGPKSVKLVVQASDLKGAVEKSGQDTYEFEVYILTPPANG